MEDGVEIRDVAFSLALLNREQLAVRHGVPLSRIDAQFLQVERAVGTIACDGDFLSAGYNAPTINHANTPRADMIQVLQEFVDQKHVARRSGAR